MPALGLTAYGVAVLVLTGTLAVADARYRTIPLLWWLPLAALAVYNLFDTTPLLLGITIFFSAIIGYAFKKRGAGVADWKGIVILPFTVPTVWPIAFAGGAAVGIGLVWLKVFPPDDVPFLAALWPPLALSVIFLP